MQESWGVICLAVLCTTLVLGLWPFHVPRNDVAWLSERAGIQLGMPATVFGFDTLGGANPRGDGPASLEVWLRPRTKWGTGTFVTLYSPGTSRQFFLRQSQKDLELRTEGQAPHDLGTARAYVSGVFRQPGPVFITLSSNREGTSVYIDGVLAQNVPGLRLSAANVDGRPIVGDALRQSQSWSGQFFGLALYERALAARQVLDHYQNWRSRGRPELTTDDRNVALYLFNEGGGRVVRSQVGSGHLYIPEKYSVLEKNRLEPAWKELEMSGSYWRAFVKNIVGFVPVGFCFYAFWSRGRPIGKPAFATIALGAGVSFVIEALQSYLPTRDSGTTDIITNTAGAALGVLLNRIICA